MFNPDQDHLSSLEERLRSWVPSPGGLDRDRMLFEAGRAEVQGPIQAGTSARLWKYATAAAVLLASGLGMAWHNERSQRRALELTFARLAPPPPAPFVSTPELITERQEKEAACRSHELSWPGPAGETPGRRGKPRAAPNRAGHRPEGPGSRPASNCTPATPRLGSGDLALTSREP